MTLERDAPFDRFLGVARAGRIVDRVLDQVQALARPGVRIDALERFAADLIERSGATPTLLGYRDAHGGGAFPAPISISVNEQIMGGHAHASGQSPSLVAGDLVTLDLALGLRGWHADAAVSWCLGGTDPDRVGLARAAASVTRAGIQAARPGRRWGEVAEAMQAQADRLGVVLLRGYDGHGVGRSMHEPPRLPSHPADQDRLEGDGCIRAGMVLAVEPVVAMPGASGADVVRDGWVDRLGPVPEGRSDACFAEATIAVGKSWNLVLAGDSWWGGEHDLWRGGG